MKLQKINNSFDKTLDFNRSKRSQLQYVDTQVMKIVPMSHDKYEN